MTPDQIKAMSDAELNSRIHGMCRGLHSVIYQYSTDLNAAWGLQYQKEIVESPDWGKAMREFGKDIDPDVLPGDYPQDPRRCARLICEAFLYLKTKGE